MPEPHEGNELKSLKLKIKTWECEFTKSYQRKPGKEDIHQASSDIKDAYKSYWTHKNKAIREKFDKEDVWSEKLNKSSKESLKIKHSSDNLMKICNKIRERSVINQQAGVKKLPHIQSKKESCTEKLENKFYINDATSNCDDLDSLKFEMRLKPTLRIMKSDNVHKRVNTINTLPLPGDFKRIKKMNFETKLDNDWLKRCFEDTLNDSCNGSDILENSFSSPKVNLHAPETADDSDDRMDYNFEPNLSVSNTFEKECSQHINNNSDDKMNCNYEPNLSFSNSFEKEYSEHTNSKSNVEYHETNSVKKYSCTQSPIKELSASLPMSQCNESHPNSTICDSDVKHPEELTSDKNEIKPDVQEDIQSKKRKLTRDAVKRKPLSHLERKMAAGTLNENFVKVNIKKKKFSRGHRTVNVRKLKWKKWKDLKNSRASNVNMSSPSACFKCGQIGHWARNCNVLTKNVQLSESNVEDFEDEPLPTLEEAAELAKKSKQDLHQVKTVKIYESTPGPSNQDDENEILLKACMDIEMESNNFSEENLPDGVVKPLFELTPNKKPIETPKDVYDALKELGYTSFRKGQETVIMRILSGLSTLVVLPTGSGKSLCYQLPAYMYAKRFNCISLVISPLVSLMEDQVTGLASCLHAVCLHSGMTDVQKKASIEALTEGKAQILLVSPEAVIGGLAYGSNKVPFSLPPVSFACIDEAHCLSQWSHNFRPSYLQLYKVLTQRMNVKCILGLTATANQSTAKEIISHLGLENMEESVVGTTGIPSNLHLSASRDKDKDRGLIQLLSGDRFSSCSSIIIYCIRRDETERLAALIRTCLQDQISDEPPNKKSKSKKRNFLWTAEAYHAGLAPPRRRSIQKQFMSGKLRVVIATIAFGMGLDKRDVRAVIHYNMPKSFESYVQEIGRAGRDGLDSHCHLFLDNEGKDMQELSRHIYSNSTDRHVIRKLLRKVFLPCKCTMLQKECSQSSESTNLLDGSDSQPKCSKHEIAFSINDTVQELDFKEENILTLLCYLELHPRQWIEVLPPTYATCSIRCYGGPKQLRSLAMKIPPVAAAFALDVKRGKKVENISTYQFQVVEVASLMGWKASTVKRELKRLEWNDQKRKTGVIVEFSDLAFHFNAPGDLSDDELDNVLDFLYEKAVESERKEIHNLKSLFSIFTKYSHSHYWACCDEAPIESSEGIKDAVNKYFDETDNSIDIQDNDAQICIEDKSDVDTEYLRSQIRDIIYTNNDQNFTGRAIARIFHGIGSPCYPAEVWGRVRKFWRCLLHINFNLILKLANDELKKSK